MREMQTLNSYFYVRTVVGSEVDVPRVLRSDRSD
jgi:hypothetical protein